MNHRMNRRDFIKLAGILPLLPVSNQLLRSNPESAQSTPLKNNVIVLVYDALTSLNMSLYGYARRTTPNFERFAQQANVYNAHYATGSFTTPGTASILTGLYPWTHRAFHLHGTVIKELQNVNLFNIVGKNAFKSGYSHNLLVSTLLYQMAPDLDQFLYAREMALMDLQYSDALFPNDYNSSLWAESTILRTLDVRPSSLFLSHLYKGLQVIKEKKLEDQFTEDFPQGITDNNGVYYILEDGIDWCINQLKVLPQPYLVYLHFLPPHHPYWPRKEFINRFDDEYVPEEKPQHRLSNKTHSQQFLNNQRQAYDEYLAYADDEFGRLLDHLLQNKILDSTYLFFTSDHGEMFERGIWGHNTRTLFDPVIRVPLIISQPGQKSRQDFNIPTSNVDLVPTILNLLNLSPLERLEGQVLPGFSPNDGISNRSIFAMEMKRNHARGPISTGSFAIINGQYKLIQYLGEKLSLFELYDLKNDPEELENRLRSDRNIARELKNELDDGLREANQRITALTAHR